MDIGDRVVIRDFRVPEARAGGVGDARSSWCSWGLLAESQEDFVWRSGGQGDPVGRFQPVVLRDVLFSAL